MRFFDDVQYISKLELLSRKLWTAMYNCYRLENVIVTDIRGGNTVSQISCILDSTCNKNFDGEFGQL